MTDRRYSLYLLLPLQLLLGFLSPSLLGCLCETRVGCCTDLVLIVACTGPLTRTYDLVTRGWIRETAYLFGSKFQCVLVYVEFLQCVVTFRWFTLRLELRVRRLDTKKVVDVPSGRTNSGREFECISRKHRSQRKGGTTALRLHNAESIIPISHFTA